MNGGRSRINRPGGALRGAHQDSLRHWFVGSLSRHSLALAPLAGSGSKLHRQTAASSQHVRGTCLVGIHARGGITARKGGKGQRAWSAGQHNERRSVQHAVCALWRRRASRAQVQLTFCQITLGRGDKWCHHAVPWLPPGRRGQTGRKSTHTHIIVFSHTVTHNAKAAAPPKPGNTKQHRLRRQQRNEGALRDARTHAQPLARRGCSGVCQVRTLNVTAPYELDDVVAATNSRSTARVPCAAAVWHWHCDARLASREGGVT